MWIDRVYELMGSAVRRVFHRTIARPVKNFNVEARAYKQLEKKKPLKWHESTEKGVFSHKDELHSSFTKVNAINPSLVDRLKEVKVDGLDKAPEPITPEKSEAEKLKLPVERFGFDLPYVFNKPEHVPAGKIAVLDILEMMITVQKEKLTAEDVVTMYDLKLEDAENILKYVEIFVATKRDSKGLELYKRYDDLGKEPTMLYVDKPLEETYQIVAEGFRKLEKEDRRQERLEEINREFTKKYNKEQEEKEKAEKAAKKSADS